MKKYGFVETDGLILLIIADKKHLFKMLKLEMLLYNAGLDKSHTCVHEVHKFIKLPHHIIIF